MDDERFWTRLEYDASRWIESADDEALRQFWIDGFLPESITDTKRGADVKGTAWVGRGGREQWPYRFIVSLPQKMLHRRRETFSIERLSFDEKEQCLEIRVISGTPTLHQTGNSPFKK